MDASSPIQREHGHTEADLTAFGVEWTALRNNFYAEVLPDVIGALQIGEQWLIPEGQHIPANRHQPNMPHSVTLSRSEGLLRWALRCFAAAQHDSALLLPRHRHLRAFRLPSPQRMVMGFSSVDAY